MEEKKSTDIKIASLVLGAILVGMGILFLVVNFIPYLNVEKLWPLFMLVPVAILIAVWIQHREKAAGVVLPIVILVFFCGYFFWLNFTSWNHVETTWPNFIIGPGLGFLGLYFTTRKWEYLIPSFILLILAAVFYAAIIGNTLIVGILLIAMGVLLILKPILKW
ncbi:MAG: hypothetical protein JSV88_13735 [Candidatus Aminicenantes bacterium]|nr:MAG: hypothetical protein JSV88_13735 [Candidatus Aminicenantes bacterium]